MFLEENLPLKEIWAKSGPFQPIALKDYWNAFSKINKKTVKLRGSVFSYEKLQL